MNIYLYILAMALTTYLIRVLPMTIFRKPIKSRFLRSFLYYVPYCCLTAMTFPSILSSTASILSGAAALVVAVILAYLGLTVNELTFQGGNERQDGGGQRQERPRDDGYSTGGGTRSSGPRESYDLNDDIPF